jgi:hypothetical protein
MYGRLLFHASRSWVIALLVAITLVWTVGMAVAGYMTYYTAKVPMVVVNQSTSPCGATVRNSPDLIAGTADTSSPQATIVLPTQQTPTANENTTSLGSGAVRASFTVVSQ